MAISATTAKASLTSNRSTSPMPQPILSSNLRTAPTGARISGLQRSMAELAARKDNELQVTRFVEVSRARLTDLTTAVQASASMPRPRRARVLRAINRELDRISGDLMTHLVGSSAA